jgi:hypothetical protein
VNEIYLRKVVGFFPHLGFSQDKSLVFFLSLVYAATAQYIYIYVNGNEVKEHK